MTDEELLIWLRVEDTNLTDFAADRIEELIAERDQHWDSFVHWRKEADDRSEQLAAARRDAEEAKAYAEELEADRKKTYEALLKVTRIHDEVEAKLAKAVEALGRVKASIENGGGGGVVDVVWLDGPCPETLCDFIDATLAEIKGQSHDPL